MQSSVGSVSALYASSSEINPRVQHLLIFWIWFLILFRSKVVYGGCVLLFDRTCELLDNCIQNFNLGRYIVGYMVGNFVLRRCIISVEP